MTAEVKRKESSDSQGLEPASTKPACTPTDKLLYPVLRGLDAKQRGRFLDLHREAREVMRGLLELEKEFEACNAELATQFEKCHHEIGEKFYNSYPSQVLQRIRSGQPIAFGHVPQLSEVSTRRDELQSSIRSSKGQFEELTKQGAASQCSPFTPQVCTSLPRELRDQVYDYLWRGDNVKKLEYFSSAPAPEEYVQKLDLVLSSKDAPPWLSSSDIASSDLPVPFFADATIVGSEFAKEAAVWYFRMLTGAEINYRHVRGYLERSTFGPMAFIPRDVISRLTIDIDFDFMVQGRGDLAYAALRDSMNSLLMLQENKNLTTIEIYLSRHLQFSRTLFHVLDIIAPVFHALEQRPGPKIKVMGYQFFTPSWKDDHERTTSKKSYATVELMNYYFAGTPEEWLAMKDEEIKADRQPRRREKCYEILNVMRMNLHDVDA